MRNFVLSLLLFGLSIAVSVLALEYGVRTLIPAYDPSGHIVFTSTSEGAVVSKKKGQLRQIKNTGDYDVTVDINDLGLRESKPLDSTKPGDLFVVGDSFSFGWGVEANERYSNVLDRMLPNRRVFNVSAPTDLEGYVGQLKYAEANGAGVGTIVVGVCMENDILDYAARAQGELRSPETDSRNLSSWLTSVKNKLRDSSAAYFLITSLIHGSPPLRGLAVKLGLIQTVEAGLHTQVFDEVVIASSVAATENLLRGRGGVALIIPSRALWAGTQKQRLEAAKIHDRFVEGLHAAGVNVADPRSEMEKTGNPLSFHFRNDGHWNAKGHALAAGLLAGRVADSQALEQVR